LIWLLWESLPFVRVVSIIYVNYFHLNDLVAIKTALKGLIYEVWFLMFRKWQGLLKPKSAHLK